MWLRCDFQLLLVLRSVAEGDQRCIGTTVKAMEIVAAEFRALE